MIRASSDRSAVTPRDTALRPWLVGRCIRALSWTVGGPCIRAVSWTLAAALLGCSAAGPVPRAGPAAEPAAEPQAEADANPPAEGRADARDGPHGTPRGEAQVQSLTLDRALELAATTHPALAAARAEVEAAEGRALQAGLYPNPRAVGRMESAPMEGRTTGDAEYVAGVSIPLVIGGRLSAARRTEEAERDRRIEEARTRSLEIESRVRATFATALYAEEAARLRAEMTGAGERSVSIVRSLLAAGDAVPEDVARSELEVLRDRIEAEKAKALRDVAAAELAAAVGDAGLRIESVAGSMEESLEVPALEALAARIAEHPAVLAAESTVSAGEARLRFAGAERIPDVHLDLFYRRIGESSENAFDVGIGVEIPIFDRNQGRIREATADIAAARARAAGVRNELAGRLRALHSDLVRALAAARVLRDEILPRAAEVLRATEARHAAGDIRLGEVLSVRRDGMRVRLDYLESLRTAHEAWAALAPFVRR